MFCMVYETSMFFDEECARLFFERANLRGKISVRETVVLQKNNGGKKYPLILRHLQPYYISVNRLINL